MTTEKKIFAEYHNPRYTRELDGELGNWAYTNESKRSKAVIKRYNYNADLIDSNGRNQLASVNYPIIGMQSQNDPDYIEYQILLAKLAYIDGFMTDFRHIDDREGVNQLELLRKIAKRYDFEIGVDWCDAQIFYSLKKIRPELDSRDKQIKYCRNIFQYLLEKIYADETGANINGHPVILLFGDGFTFEEYARLKRESSGFTDKEPWYFRRTVMECSYDGRTVTYKFDENHEYFKEENRQEIAGSFGWIPFRLRDAVADGKPYWDIYATPEDCLAYLETLRSHVHENRDCYQAWISIAAPGMDQRGCAAWGRSISCLERGHGEIYRDMWEYNVAHRDGTDAVFIASWNDFNEGHEIEPTLENGYRELELTAQYGTQFKGIEQKTRSEDFRLPKYLFKLRKSAAKLKAIGYDVSAQQEELDTAARLIAERNGSEALQQLFSTEKKISDLWDRISTERVNVPEFRIMSQSARENIAGKAKVKISSELPTCEGRRAADGEKMRSFWQSEEGEASIELTWETEKAVSCIKLFTGWTERSDRPNWPMIPKQLTVEYRASDGWTELWSTDENETQDIEIDCGYTTDALRISSKDNVGLLIRDIEVLKDIEGQIDGIGCYDGAGFQIPDELAARIRGKVFDGYLTFQYWDEGVGAFEVKSAGKFKTVCCITMDDTRAWRSARVRLYTSNTAWNHEMNLGADLLFCGSVKVKNVAAEFDVYKKSL